MTRWMDTTFRHTYPNQQPSFCVGNEPLIQDLLCRHKPSGMPRRNCLFNFVSRFLVSFSFYVIILKCSSLRKTEIKVNDACRTRTSKQTTVSLRRTITSSNQTEKQLLINIHWQNVGLSLTVEFYYSLCLCQVGKSDKTTGGVGGQ